MQPFSLLRVSPALFALATLSCSDVVTDPPLRAEGSFTVDASAGWVYVSLADSATVVPTPSARESAAWDIGFFSTNVTLNGGEAGPGDVVGACICQNAGATDAQILAMTEESEEAEFTAVATVPATATFVAEQLTAAISGWYAGSGASATANADNVFLVRLADGTSFAKVHVTGIEGATATSAGRVTLEYAVQPSATAAFGATKTIVLDGTASGASSASVDLNADAFSTAAGWDVRLVGWNIIVNGGVSGPGSAAAATGSGTFESITTASTAPQAYRTDVYAGVFGQSRWYKYNLAGDNRISPTFDVYLVKRGSSIYKLQLTNYYSATGAPRHITFKYEQIAP